MPTSRRFAGLLTMACSWPVALHAAEISIPELGVELVDVPVGVERPEMKRRFDGYTATLHFGKATLRIDRFDEEVPSGSDIKSASFRATQEPPSYTLHPHARGQATTINGHDAWTSAFSLPDGAPGSHLVGYTSVTYALVDQHVYSLAAYGSGADAPPSDFLAAVRAISGLRFVSVDRSAVSDSEPRSGLIRMPYFDPSSKDYCPAASKRRDETGVVDLKFSIDGKGQARDVEQIHAATEDLETSARSLLTDVKFHLASGWEDKGYQKLRFTIEIKYVVRGSSPPGGKESPPSVSDLQVVVVCSR